MVSVHCGDYSEIYRHVNSKSLCCVTGSSAGREYIKNKLKGKEIGFVVTSSVQSLSHVQFFVTP